jgi:hypothetical protein
VINKNLDPFKLIITIILLFILVFLIIQKPGMKIPADSENNGIDLIEENSDKNEEKGKAEHLPDLPLMDGSLSLNDSEKGLVGTDGIERFVLSDDQKRWEPVITEDVLTKLPNDFRLSQDESGVWYITDVSGTGLYILDLELLEWMELSSELEDEEAASGTGNGGEIITCEGANPTRLNAIGSQVKVVNATIPLRSSPDANAVNIIKPLSEGTVLKIIKSPVCTPLLNGANLWWGVQIEGGLEGWAAEASAITDVYYLQEVR